MKRDGNRRSRKEGEEEGDDEETRRKTEKESYYGCKWERWKRRGLGSRRDEGVVTHVARDGRVLIRAECIYEHARIRRTCARGSFNG